MIQKGYGMEFSHNLEVVAHRLQLASDAVRKVAPVALTEVGVYVLGEVMRDYRAKSKGQADKAGNTWPMITRGAIITRFHRRPSSPYMKATADIIRMRNEEQTVLEDLRRRLPRGRSPARNAQRGAIASAWYETPAGRKAKGIRKRINTKRTSRRGMVDRDHSKAAIGVDTGRLVNSLDFRKQSPEMLLNATATTVTVGTVVSYAKHFDAKRAIIASNFMTPARVQRCESIMKKHVDRVIKDTLGDAGAQA